MMLVGEMNVAETKHVLRARLAGLGNECGGRESIASARIARRAEIRKESA